MGRSKKQVLAQSDGNYRVEVVVPGLTWELAVSMASRWGGIKPIAAFLIMLQKLDLLFAEGEDPLGGEYTAALQRLQLARSTIIDEPGVPPIEFGLLHASKKTKSGFTGVYANGQGFRAMGKVPGQPGTAAHCIGTFPTAEEAAWRRRLYYKANNLPYGEYEDALEALRCDSRARGWSEEALHKEVIWQFGFTGNTAALENVPPQYEEWVGRDWMMEEQMKISKRINDENAAERAASDEKRAKIGAVYAAKYAIRDAKRAADKLAGGTGNIDPVEAQRLRAEIQDELVQLGLMKAEVKPAKKTPVKVEEVKVAEVKVETKLPEVKPPEVKIEEAKVPDEVRDLEDSKRELQRLAQERKEAKAVEKERRAAALKAALTPTGEYVNGIALLPMPIDPSTWVDTHDDPIVDEPAVEPEPVKSDPWSAMRSYRPAT